MMLARLAARRTARPAGALLQQRQLLRTTAAAKADFLEHGANSKLYKEQKNKNRPSLERLSRGSRESRGSRDSD